MCFKRVFEKFKYYLTKEEAANLYYPKDRLYTKDEVYTKAESDVRFMAASQEIDDQDLHLRLALENKVLTIVISGNMPTELSVGDIWLVREK